MNEADLRDTLVRLARSLFERGLTAGSSGNISARLSDGFLVTPTNSCMGFLEASRLSKLNPAWEHISGDAPTKELDLHRAFYDARPHAGAVVHLHSTYATLISCLADTNPQDCIPPITPYVVMRVGRVPLLPYRRPGDGAIRAPVLQAAANAAAVLIANHGPVVSGPTLAAAVYAAEELEETAKLVVLSRGATVRLLDADALADLRATFGTP